MKIFAILATLAVGVAPLSVSNAEPDKLYVDCSAPADQPGRAGTRPHPFTTLDQVNAVTLGPGSEVYLKRGSTCTGTLAPQGSGAAGSPVLIGAYGDEDEPKPRIDAAGAEQALLLHNNAHIEVRDLDLTAPGDHKSTRRGAYVVGEDAGTLAGIVLRGLDVHDVRGILNGPALNNGKFGNASGGIVVEAKGSTTPTAFQGLRILDNNLWEVDREGIYTWSNWCNRPQLGTYWSGICTADWFPSTGTVIRGNRLHQIGGDGIAVKMNVDALVERNTVDGYNMRSGSYNAGMWTANSDNVLFQHNVGAHGKTTLDGNPWDVDHATSGVIFQYNFSYENEGGWLLLCPTDTGIRNFTVRYNISVNDRFRGVENCSGPIESGTIHNNTLYIGDGVTQVVVNENNANPRNVRFANNAVVRSGTGKASFNLRSGKFTFDHNLFSGVAAPAAATDSVLDFPLFTVPGALYPQAYQLRPGSPAIGAGAVFADNGGRDFFANPLPVDGPVAIGAHQPR